MEERNMKIYKYFAMAALAVMGLTATSCGELSTFDNPVLPITRVWLMGDGTADGKTTLPVGGTLQLTLDIRPANANVIDLIWVSTNEDVATIDANGLITALRSGQTKIFVYSESNPNVTDAVELTVAGGAVSISSKLVDQKDAD